MNIERRTTWNRAGKSQLPRSSLPRPASAPTCAGSNPSGGVYSFVYAIGRIEARFSSLGIEKEFAQATARGDNTGKTDRQTLHEVISRREHRYLLRHLCWVMTVEGVETYILRLRDASDTDLLVEALRPTPRPTDVDVVIGVRGSVAPPSLCNGLQVPIVGVDQIYSFDMDTLIKSIPRPEAIPADQFGLAAEELFLRLMQIADNAGASDEHRALNYLAVRYPATYAIAAEAFGRNASLTAVEVRPSRLSGTRKIDDVVFTFTNRNTDVMEKYFTRVDVTEEFPFLVTKMAPYYDR